MTGTLEPPVSNDLERMKLQGKVDALKIEISNIRNAKKRNEDALQNRLGALSRLEGQLALCGPARSPSPHE